MFVRCLKSEMEAKKSCRWGLLIRQASVIGRFKNKLRLKKLEWKKFYEQMWGPEHLTPESENEFPEWPDSNHGTEGSCSSQYNSQYFDSLTQEEILELAQQGQIPGFLSHQNSVNIVPSQLQHDGMLIGTQGLDHGQQQPTPWMDHMDSFDSNPISVNEYLDAENTDEYADTISEWLQLDGIRVQGSLSSPRLGNRSISAPISGTSFDSTGNMDMRDSGNSSAIPVRPEDRLQWFKQFFDIGAEEALTKPRQGSTGRGWRVMVRIVCACRKLSKLLRTRRLERNQPQGQVIVRKRSRGFGENRSQLYKGVRKRNGKWVSEIRVGQTNEKVWLGSYDTEKEAALAFDAGKYYCSAKRCRSFNFPDSPRLLGPPINLKDLTPKDRKKTIQRLAEDHAKACAAAQI
ncbi:hypothetical protein M758_10G092100 [Ceratodon purpureus]|nr:hypothetical protein M758_10G092100 [Ceratodon purpureus]